MSIFVGMASRRSRTAIMCAALAACLIAPYQTQAAESGNHPDFSGVWAVLRFTGPIGKFFMPAEPPLSANGQKIVDEFRAKYDVEKYNMEPNGYCVEHGMPSIMWGLGGAPMEIIQQPKRITLLSEATNQFRFMYLDGRKAPTEYPHTRNGYSIGHWEGDTLVVETNLIEEWKLARWPHSENTTFTEKYSLIDFKDMPVPEGGLPRIRGSQHGDPDKVLAVEITMTDPDFYDKPVTMTYYYRKLPNQDFFEDTCSTGIWWEQFENRIAEAEQEKAAK